MGNLGIFSLFLDFTWTMLLFICIKAVGALFVANKGMHKTHTISIKSTTFMLFFFLVQ